jgi:hypothetical protein
LTPLAVASLRVSTLPTDDVGTELTSNPALETETARVFAFDIQFLL